MIKQISVFLPNKPGVLAAFTEVLMKKSINLRAVIVAETADYGILRIIVDKPEECIEALKKENYLVSVTDVIAFEVPDKPGALHGIAKLLGENGVNIEYLYSTILRDEAIIIMRVSDIEKTKQLFNSKNIKLVDAHQF
ncbi:MAG: ACT domain-containing protein [Candidatus Helarchaeales archaeon]